MKVAEQHRWHRHLQDRVRCLRHRLLCLGSFTEVGWRLRACRCSRVRRSITTTCRVQIVLLRTGCASTRQCRHCLLCLHKILGVPMRMAMRKMRRSCRRCMMWKRSKWRTVWKILPLMTLGMMKITTAAMKLKVMMITMMKNLLFELVKTKMMEMEMEMEKKEKRKKKQKQEKKEQQKKKNQKKDKGLQKRLMMDITQRKKHANMSVRRRG